MIEKVVTKRTFKNDTAGWEDIQYWLSRPPGERMVALEELRRHFYGNLSRSEELFGFLNARNVEYVVVGGYAVAHHGLVRATKDIDIYGNHGQCAAGLGGAP